MGEPQTPRKRTRTRKPELTDDPAWVAKRAAEVERNRIAFEAEHGCTVDEWVAERIARTRPFRDLLLGKSLLRTDPFTELGIEANATPAQVRRAFRALALRRHPDRGGTQEAFVRLEEAYRAALMMAELKSRKETSR